jgi:hypothetical protein
MSTTPPEQHRATDSQPYYRKFELRELCVDTDVFLAHIRPIYEALQWDMYDTIRGGLKQPTRQRALAEFTIEQDGNDWKIQRVPAQPYVQPTNHGNYNRTEPRPYPEVPVEVTEHSEVLKLQKAVAEIVRSVRSDATKLRMIFTFLRTVDEEGRSGKCALEGAPHLDGMDYIVSALVINRVNLKPETGESSVYTLEQQKLMHAVLQPGEGIFQDDLHLMHHITNIQRDVREKRGIRDMLGIDVQILPKVL